ncbi:unnamed protein product [Urochloa humidicola]
MVALSTFGRHYCRHPAFRFLVWGASTVFLPLTSSIITSLLKRSTEPRCDGASGKCLQPRKGKANPDNQNMWTLLLWIVLILTIKCNADVAAAAVAVAAASPSGGDASVDGQRIRPPVEHLAMYAWCGYLIWLCVPVAGWLGSFNRAVFFAFSALGLVKLALKLAAFWMAGGSFALGKNARLIAGYMAQQLAGGGGYGDGQVPRHIVMGEAKKHVEESADGYRIKRGALDDRFSSLVTLDRVWLLAEHGNGVLAQRPELRDLCLSYSLFKLLRRRLSGYALADAGSRESLDFVLGGMGGGGAGVDADRVFRVLVNELWFASDFYYSPIPLCIFGGWCAALNYLCSVLLVVGAVAVGWIYKVKDVVHSTPYKVAITVLLLGAVVVVEAWEVVSGVRSNWTKMALLGHYIRHEKAWRKSSCVHAALAAVLRLQPATRWRDKIGQNSVLEPGRFLRRSGLLSEKLYGKAGLMRSIDLSLAVKESVIRSLLSSYGRMSKEGSAPAARRVGGQKSWAWDGGDVKSNTEQILVWHVATRLFEMKSTSASPDMIAASHLSNYFAYLVAAAPELLPDSAEWSKRRYKEVSEDVRAALPADNAGESATQARYEQMTKALSAASRDAVLRRGAELGRHLVEQYGGEDEASACRILADFWSEMALYVAPSENVKGHVQAMARGGEFITLIWALLLHAGITTRPDRPGGGAAIP